MNRPDKELFFGALDLSDPVEQARFLDTACGEDADQLRRVKELLTLYFQKNPFMKAPAAVSAPVLDQVPSDDTGARIGSYKLLEKIGEGGFGTVYVAEQKEPVKRRVALKIIKLGMDTRQVVARFETERQALAMMDHPNIAKVFEAGATQSGRPYFAMELVRGVRITQFCDENRLTTVERLKLFTLVCQAIQHAHQKGIIHRDIKPSNIIVTLHDGVPVPKVIDFGIAKATGGDLTDKTVYTQFQQFIGTPAYISPEQAEMSGLGVDTRSDIYALGVLLYELLTGQTPFDANELIGSGLDQMRRTIREKEPLRPSTKLGQTLGVAVTKRKDDLPGAPDLPSGNPAPEGALESASATRRAILDAVAALRGDLDWIIMKCLEKDRNRRYATANGLARDIQLHLNNEPVSAAAPTAAYKMGKFVRRNRKAVAAGVAIVLLLVIGIITSSAFAIRTASAERNATHSRDRLAEANKNLSGQLLETERERRRADAEKRLAEGNLYVANMNLTRQAWEQNNLPVGRRLLGETAAFPERGFEWFYWQGRMHPELKTFPIKPGFSWAAFSPDGQRVVTGDVDGIARIWQTESGAELLVLKGHSGWLYTAFSPDGQRIATAGQDHTARIWDAASGRELLVFRGHTGEVLSVVFSSNGKQILTSSADKTTRLWEADTGKELLTLQKPDNRLTPAVFSPDSRRIVTGGLDGPSFWDATEGRLLSSCAGIGIVQCLALSPDGKTVAVGGQDGKLRMWEPGLDSPSLTLTAHRYAPMSVAFSPDGKRIATGGSDRAIRVLESATGRELFEHKGHNDALCSIVFSPDGLTLLSSGADGTARIWSAESNGEALTLKGHKHYVYSVAFSPDGGRLVTSGHDGTVILWDAETGEQLRAFRGHTGDVGYLAFFPDGQRIVTTGADATARIWDLKTGGELLAFRGHKVPIYPVAVFPDGTRVVTSDRVGIAKVWESGSGKELLTRTNIGRSLAISPDGRRILSAGPGNRSTLWDPDTGRELLSLPGQNGAVAFSPNGKRIITVGGEPDRTAKARDAETGRELFTIQGHTARITSVEFSADGRRVLTASMDKTARVWDAETGQQLLTLKGHDGALSKAAFSPNGWRIATSSHDGTARIWRAASPEQIVRWKNDE